MQIEVDPTFVTGVRTSEPDLEADWKIRKKYEDEKKKLHF
jgi:hypothetical protein